ncbi:helix-turn-helix domain-containing protein [Fictibacillus sp. NPDC058756]|uniref:helix-turn-helix domain-containing protein n=1 Tax=Fictibacillus sp. NPDC058756 TaxID=3346625 RepID=UPI00369FCFB9
MPVNCKKLGEEIKNIRRVAGISQKELAEGICNQSEISRIEAGTVFPNLDTLFQISLKLRVSIPYLLLKLLYDRDDYIIETINYIEALSERKNYQEIYELSSNELKNGSNIKSISFYIFLKWNFHMASYYVKASHYLDCIQELKNILSNNFVYERHNFQDLRIKNVIANIYAENNCFEDSYRYYEEIISEQISSKAFNIYKIKVLYNYSKTHFSNGDIKKALELVNKGIKLSLELKNMSLIGQLYYQKGSCYEILEKDNHEEIANNYKRSLFFFELLGMELYEKHAKEKKAIYLK